VAHGFLRVPGIRVVILYPSKRISEAQEKQFTTLGENITALEVAGTFDDCQRLVKLAFSDVELNKHAWLTSANSINIGRLLPQMFYHVAAYRQLPVASVAADRFRAQRELRQPYGGNLRQTHRLAGSEICGLHERQRCGSGISADRGVSSARGAGDLFECHGRRQSK